MSEDEETGATVGAQILTAETVRRAIDDLMTKRLQPASPSCLPPGITVEGLVAELRDVPAAPPARCPCGHQICDDYRCIAGGIYGPCEHELCGGVCEYHGDCKGDGCACKEDE